MRGLGEISTAVRRYFEERSSGAVRVEPTLNWGGFVNVAFEVSDGCRTYHLKLADDPGIVAGLLRWRELAPILEARYHAPPILEWIELEDASLSGLLFERSPGRPLDLDSSPLLLAEIVALVERLHKDEELERSLREMGVVDDARGSVLEHYVGHLEADLAESGEKYPVTASTRDWMRKALGELRGLIEREEAFDLVEPTPIHGDLWKDNVLVEPEGGWLVIDWDGLQIGDPVIDYATLLWPLQRDGVDPSPWLGRHAEDPSFRARLDLCARAALLDEVIDSLADWVEARKMPAHTERVRAEKVRIHERALAEYRERYA